MECSSTTLSAQENENSTSLAVASATNLLLVNGLQYLTIKLQWVAANGAGHSLRDEGFIIHDSRRKYYLL